MLLNHELISDIVIPISTFLAGSFLSYFATAQQYKKKVHISIDTDEHIFRIYNIGNAGIVIREVGITQRKNVLFSMPLDKTLTTDADPMKISYSEDEFWLSVESAIQGGKLTGKFYCFVVSASNQKYKTKAPMSLSDLWNYHEYYWGRNPNEVEDKELPF